MNGDAMEAHLPERAFQAPACVTGLGVVSTAGGSVAETRSTFASGASRPPGRAVGFASPLDLPVHELTTVASPPGRRALHLALLAVREALDDAGLPTFPDPSRVGVCLGTTVGSQLNDLDFYAAWRQAGTAPPEAVDRYLNGNPGEAVARACGATGPCLTVCNACSSGTDAIGQGLAWIRAGLCDIVIAGGTDELSRIPLCGFHALGVYSREPCRPFDVARQGLNLGEGAGIVVLERAAHAARRSRAARLGLYGFGAAADAYHLTGPRPDGSGIAQAVRSALADARVVPRDVAFVNAHGTGTLDNDRIEGAALAAVFGPDVVMLSTKGFTGHTLGAAGGIEAVFTAMGLHDGWIPACAGLVQPDPAIPVRAVTRRTGISGRYAVSTSLAFGGSNAALVFGCLPQEGAA